MIEPILVGPQIKIEAEVKAAGRRLNGIEMIDAPLSHAAAAAVVALVRVGKALALMLRSLHPDELMEAVVNEETGLRTAAA
ncbi:hypothetical protein [Pseudoruegeria sp. SK021]|uniref:hypothetical protein n=1 Tax=Pseudoruegeria sp. SK021 TaxID=1933035 RepID=UPI000A22FF38|nr:hypothetical protein [Pseudoruegeria sp. SK021]OSP52958.1 hypothetical protein BV911_18360 [Pseudoruegeria sp. SK021]